MIGRACELANVIVFVGSGRNYPTPATPAVSPEGLQYDPHVSAVQVGQRSDQNSDAKRAQRARHAEVTPSSTKASRSRA